MARAGVPTAGPGVQVPGHDRAGTDDRPAPIVTLGRTITPSPEPDVVADRDRLGVVGWDGPGVLRWWEGRHGDHGVRRATWVRSTGSG
jgi:hypothetical protein